MEQRSSQQGDSETSLIHLNLDCFKLVCLHLRAQDLVALSQTCKYFSMALQKKNLWGRAAFPLTQALPKGKGRKARKNTDPREICIKYALGLKLLPYLNDREARIFQDARERIHSSEIGKGCPGTVFVASCRAPKRVRKNYFDVVYEWEGVKIEYDISVDDPTCRAKQTVIPVDIEQTMSLVFLTRPIFVKCTQCLQQIVCNGSPSLLAQCMVLRVKFVANYERGDQKVKNWQKM